MPTCYKKKQGFTLLELLIVVSIMAIIAGVSVMSYTNTRSDSEYQAAKVEMEQLRQAVIGYFRDQNNYINNTHADSPADIVFLIDQVSSWDPDYRKGWRGPYMQQSLTGYSSVILNGLGFDGNGDPSAGTEVEVLVKKDPFLQPKTASSPRYYNPYLFFDLDTYNSALKTARIVSMGADGVYEPPDCDFSISNVADSGYCSHDKLCEQQGDDLVLCL